MVLLGAIVNAAAMLLGGGVGLLLKKGISEKLKNTLISAMALCVVAIGIKGALKTENFLIMIISITAGGFIGELIDIDDKLNRFGAFLQSKLSKSDKSSFSEGFVTTTLYVCVGAMAIVGAIEAGMKSDFTTYYAKSVLDGLSTMIFTASFGAGCILAAPVLLLYQGSMTLAAQYIAVFLSEPIITEMSAVGSLIIVAIGLNMLKITKIKVGNLIPATFLPILLCQFL